jgi:Putative transposase of IS4/5 family (DUF4096)
MFRLPHRGAPLATNQTPNNSITTTGCQWHALPKDLPPKSTVWAYSDLWTWDGTLERIHHALYVGGTRAGGTELANVVELGARR